MAGEQEKELGDEIGEAVKVYVNRGKPLWAKTCELGSLDHMDVGNQQRVLKGKWHDQIFHELLIILGFTYLICWKEEECEVLN